MSSDQSPQQSHKRKRLKLLLLVLSLAAFSNSLLPQAVKAGVLDSLSDTIQNSVNQVTNTISSPIRQVENGVQRAIGSVENSVTNPINNAIGGINQTIESILSPFQLQLQQYFQIFNQSFQNILNDVLGDILGSDRQPWDERWEGGLPEDGNGGAVPSTDNTGPLGIPDFVLNHKGISNKVLGSATNGTPSAASQRVDQFNLNPLALAQSMQFMQDRAQNNGMAATVLSGDGQAAMKREMEAASATLQQIQAKAQEAQGMDVTQDVMKNLTAMQSGQSALLSGSYAQLMALRAQDAANAVVTSNISETLDEETRAKHAESMAGADRVLRASAGFYLPGMVK